METFIKGSVDMHKKFQQWRDDNFIANRQCYILNCKGPKGSVLHGNICLHLDNTTWQPPRKNWGTFANTTKRCSLDKNELINWAKEAGFNLKFCKSCNP